MFKRSFLLTFLMAYLDFFVPSYAMLVVRAQVALNRHIVVVVRSVTTPRHGRGHGPRLPWLLTTEPVQVVSLYPFLIFSNETPRPSPNSLACALMLSPYFTTPPAPIGVEFTHYHFQQLTFTGYPSLNGLHDPKAYS